MILGGGVGSRLYPLTEQRSKPAVPIGGKYRLIDIPISNCLNSGVKRMFVLTQFNSASLNQHIKNTYHFDIFSRGFVDILAAEQTRASSDWYQGTADAVRQCMHHLWNHEYDYILILSGDQLYQMDFEKMAKYHMVSEADLTIATIPVNAADASGFGIMKVNKGGYIDSFIEKPSQDQLGDWSSQVSEENQEAGKIYLASMGIYIFSKNAIKKLFADDPGATDFGKQIIPAAIQSGYTVASYQYDGYWTDIGSIGSFFEANIELTDSIPQFNLFDNNKMIYTRPRLLAPSKIFGTRFLRAVIAEGSIIHADTVEQSVVGIRSRIGAGTHIKKCVIMGNDYFETLEEIVEDHNDITMGIGENCFIENAIVDKNCRIGNNVTIKGDPSLEDTQTDQYCIRDGVIVLRKGAVIAHNSKIGIS
ncbi:MAG: glucose-1-phosphate adenylyltransferase [Bacteroidota bacterium]